VSTSSTPTLASRATRTARLALIGKPRFAKVSGCVQRPTCSRWASGSGESLPNSMPRQVTTGGAVLALLCVVAGASAASGRTSSLSWVQLPGAEACGGASEIARAVERHLGRAAFVSPAQADVSIEGHAEREGERFRAVLVLRDSAGAQLGTRQIESDVADCSELRENVALAVALMIDPDAVLHPAPQRPPSLPPPPRVVIQRVEVPVDMVPPAPWQVEPGASAVIGGGFMPSASVGVLLGATILPPRFWPLEVYGGVWEAQSVAAHPSGSARFTAAFGGLGLCPLRVRSADLAFQLCGAGQVGVVSSEPAGFVTSQSGSLPTVHLVADAHVSLDVARGVLVRAGGSLGVALLRSEFAFDNSAGTQTLFDPPTLAATADLGVAVTLP
jgi:hypothetical protein